MFPLHLSLTVHFITPRHQQAHRPRSIPNRQNYGESPTAPSGRGSGAPPHPSLTVLAPAAACDGARAWGTPGAAALSFVPHVRVCPRDDGWAAWGKLDGAPSVRNRRALRAITRSICTLPDGGWQQPRRDKGFISHEARFLEAVMTTASYQMFSVH
ncbi:hypothetical protein Bbelb_366150 [Branchiostoma belcheri]|nr:hypothetical protein Bbelb_366150 [Branchiostoma belcheri]